VPTPHRANPAARLPAPAQSYRLYATALRALRDWPRGLHAFLDAYQARHPGPRPQGNGACAKLGALFSRWVQREWRHPAFAFLQEAVDEYLLRDVRLVQSVLRSGRYRGQPDQLARSTFVTKKQAAHLLGVDAGGMRLLLRTGRLTAHEVLETRRGGRFQMLRRSEVEALAAEVRQEISLAEAQRLLGVERNVVKGLVANGLLAAVRRGGDGSPRWAFRRAAVARCLAAVLRHTGRLRDERRPAFTLTQASTALGRIGLDGTGILAAVAAGELRAYHPVSAPTTLGALRFARDDLAAYQHDFAARRGWLRPNEVMRLLGIDHTRLRRLAAAGLLVPVADYPAIRFFARAAVEAFQEEYVSSAGAARLLGVSRPAVQRWTARGRLQPVCGPGVDGGHTYLYRKADLVRWRAERLTFGEAQALLGVSKATLDRWAKQGKVVPLAEMGGMQRWFRRQDIVRLRATLVRNPPAVDATEARGARAPQPTRCGT
jgi:predicted site-specific integrase-resolvase